MIRIASFSGELPRVIPRLLPENNAQVALNTKMENGALVPTRRARYAWHLPNVCRSIYLDKDEWLGWPGYVDVVPAPIAEDRLYVTGDGAPKLIAGGATYPLAVPHPVGALTASITGTPDPELQSTILYSYTYLTAFDEESEPAPLSNELLWSPGIDVTLDGFQLPPGGRAINRMRIYRSQTSSLGETTLYFIHERPVTDAKFVDVVASNPFNEPIPSLAYNAPPDGLQGIKAMPNGMMVGFMGKRIYFCEPYRPHAWPEAYILTTDYEIVGLGVSGTSLAIMTKGQPYVATGTTPDSMSMEKLPVNLPCVSAQGIVDLGYVVAYPSDRGLVTVSQNGATLVTESLLTRDQWQTLNPYSFIAGQFNGRYLVSYAYANADGIENRGMLVLDLSGSQPFLLRASDDADAMFNEIGTGALYILRNGQDIWEWDAISEPFGEMVWKSKRFVLPGHTNFGAIFIEGEDVMSQAQRDTVAAKNAATRAANRARILAGTTGGTIGEEAVGVVTFGGSLLEPVDDTEATFAVTIYADGKPVAVVDKMNQVERLPAGFLATTWEIEVRSNQMVTAISIGSSPSELAG